MAKWCGPQLYPAREPGTCAPPGIDEATAKAWPVEGGGNARLKVQFFWPFRADCWAIGLDADYRWAVVGNPERKYLWILSRTPRLPKERLDAALASASARGFVLAKLRCTPQGGALAATDDRTAGGSAEPPLEWGYLFFFRYSTR